MSTAASPGRAGPQVGELESKVGLGNIELASAIERLPDAVLIADDERHYVHANPAACVLFGLQREDLIGRRIEQFAEPQYREAIAEHWATFLTVGVQAGPFRLLRPDGEVREVEFSAVARIQPNAHISFLRDVTDQRRAEETQREQTRELARSNMELQRFAYVASHDLKEPLRNLSIFSQLLARRYGDELDDNARRYIDEITTGAARMTEMIDGLLTYSRASMQRDTVLEEAETNQLVDQARDNLRVSIQQRRAVITRDELPSIRCAPLDVVQLFQNLIGNAIKYCEERPEIHVSCEDGAGEWVFRVRDNGIGVPLQYQEQIFGVFKRLHNREYPGTGIGLAICQAIVERHRGHIGIESEPGKGATFWFTIPR